MHPRAAAPVAHLVRAELVVVVLGFGRAMDKMHHGWGGGGRNGVPIGRQKNPNMLGLSSTQSGKRGMQVGLEQCGGWWGTCKGEFSCRAGEAQLIDC